MSRVIGTITLYGVTFDLTAQDPAYGDGFGWSTGPGPGQRGCTGFDTVGAALDHGIQSLGLSDGA